MINKKALKYCRDWLIELSLKRQYYILNERNDLAILTGKHIERLAFKLIEELSQHDKKDIR